jgi:raffinose/stachyose/melibiose transport system substrate-binding protein
VQKEVTVAGTGLPVNPAAASSLPIPALKDALAANAAASYVQTYFDIALPTQPGQNLDTAVANFFAGQGSAQSVIGSVSTH